jgi:hypothetical protein
MNASALIKRICFSVMLLLQVRVCLATDACLNTTQYELKGRLVLKSSWLDADRGFIGRFELSDVESPKKIEFRGMRRKFGFLLDYPDVVIEARDKDQKWVLARTELAGTFLAPPDSLVLAPGAKVTFVATLLPQEDLAGKESELRLLVHPHRPGGFCIASGPFHVVLSNGLATGIVPSE